MKKKYMAPEAAEMRLAPYQMIMTSVEVNLGEEGNQQDAESKRFWAGSLWDDTGKE